MMKLAWIGLFLIALPCRSLLAQNATSEIAPARESPVALEQPTGLSAKLGGARVATGNRWMLVCCGLPGDDGHREKLTTAVEQIVGATESVFQIAPTRLRVLVGDAEMVDALKDTKARPVVCSSESVAGTLKQLSGEIQADDSLWIVFLGHAQLYSGRSTFNVQGIDFDAKEFSKRLAPIQCRERVLMLTMPVSGFWMKPLRGPKTILISATDADLEITGTEMPYALASVVSGNSEQALEDIDQDGNVSLLDLYLAVNLEIHTVFKSMERLQTEHAQIDDNGDGVGRELQTPFIPVETPDGETAKPIVIRTTATNNGEGEFARTLQLGIPIQVPREATVE